MDDDMINLLGKKEGIIQINFGSDFLDARVAKIRTANRKELDKRLKKLHLRMEDESAKPVIEEFTKEYPGIYSDVARVADHIDHARKIAGIESVGFGSDFDGVGDSLPEGLKDVSQYPNLIMELLKRGYTEEDIEKLCYKNVWRVWHKVTETAASK